MATTKPARRSIASMLPKDALQSYGVPARTPHEETKARRAVRVRTITDPKEAEELGVVVGDAVELPRTGADTARDHGRAVEKVKAGLRAAAKKAPAKKKPAAKKKAKR